MRYGPFLQRSLKQLDGCKVVGGVTLLGAPKHQTVAKAGWHLTGADAIWFGFTTAPINKSHQRQRPSTHDHSHDAADRWKHDGVRVIPGNQLDPNVPSMPGMDRKAAINFARAGAQKLWAGTVTIKPDAKTGAHHHGHLESIIYVVRGKARMRWGEHLQFTAEAGPGDFIFIPPYVPHQEINAPTEGMSPGFWRMGRAVIEPVIEPLPHRSSRLSSRPGRD
jgi:uncharacterized RmlC-like cupin family protein